MSDEWVPIASIYQGGSGPRSVSNVLLALARESVNSKVSPNENLDFESVFVFRRDLGDAAKAMRKYGYERLANHCEELDETLV